MKYTLAFLLAVSACSVQMAQAQSTADLARANCVKALMRSSAQVTRNMVNGFRFSGDGSGYELSGVDENHNQVSCKAAADGHVTWINGG